MKGYVKILAMGVLIIALPVQAAIMNFSLDNMIVAQPVVLPSTSSTSDVIPTQPIQPLDNIVLQNTTLNLEPLVILQQEFKTFDLKLMSQYELQIFNNLQTQLNIALQPKTFDVDEKEFDKTLVAYREDRVAQIKSENAGNIAEINDQLGVLDDEIGEFSVTLKSQLQSRAVLMEREQEQLVLNLQLSLADFKTYYQFKQEEDSTLRSGSLTESPTVMTMETKLIAAADTYKQVEEQQDSFLAAVTSAKAETSDDSLKVIYLTDVEMQVQKDTETLNVLLDDLQVQREKIVTLSDDIKLLSEPIQFSDAVVSDDKIVLEEQTVLLEAKEMELQQELNTYYQMQQETQVVLNTSIATFATFSLN
jgi:hypothetical protein